MKLTMFYLCDQLVMKPNDHRILEVLVLLRLNKYSFIVFLLYLFCSDFDYFSLFSLNLDVCIGCYLKVKNRFCISQCEQNALSCLWLNRWRTKCDSWKYLHVIFGSDKYGFSSKPLLNANPSSTEKFVICYSDEWKGFSAFASAVI